MYEDLQVFICRLSDYFTVSLCVLFKGERCQDETSVASVGLYCSAPASAVSFYNCYLL